MPDLADPSQTTEDARHKLIATWEQMMDAADLSEGFASMMELTVNFLRRDMKNVGMLEVAAHTLREHGYKMADEIQEVVDAAYGREKR